MNDEIGENHLVYGENAYLTTDRFGCSKSAIRINNGYLKAPLGIYFQDDFTIIAWVKVNSARFQSRILDFGNGGWADNIEFGFFENSNRVFLKTWIEDSGAEFLTSEKSIKINEWCINIFY